MGKFERKKTSVKRAADKTPCYIKCLPPEIMEKILLQLSVCDVVTFGATCTTFYYQLRESSFLWRRIYNRMLYKYKALSYFIPQDYRHLAIFRTLTGRQALHKKRLCTDRAPTRVAVEQALGYRRVMPTRNNNNNNVVLWDYQGTLFLMQGYTRVTDILCHGVRDFDVGWRFIYAMLDGGVRVFNETGEHMKNLTIGTESTLRFTQIRYTGQWFDCSGLVLLTASGEVYHMIERRAGYVAFFPSVVNFRRRLRIIQLHTTANQILLLTVEGEAYLEVFTWPFYRHTPFPVHLPVPSKVVKCSIGEGHLCLIDEYGCLYARGCNGFGQLGTGDTEYREDPTQVALSMTTIDVWCGLTHTLALLQGESGPRKVYGCGDGEGGCLPGWPEGSASFVKLEVQVPPAARSLCASKGFLYVLSGPDVTEHPHPPPPVALTRVSPYPPKERSHIFFT